MERWPDALSLLARIFGGRGAQISVAASLNVIAFVKLWGWTDDELARFVPAYLALTPTDPRAGLVETRYKAMHCRQFVSDEVLWASEMYKQALSPGGVEYSMAFTLPIDPGMTCVLAVMRGPDHAPLPPATAQNLAVWSRMSVAP
jgi:hypothetical protein